MWDKNYHKLVLYKADRHKATVNEFRNLFYLVCYYFVEYNVNITI